MTARSRRYGAAPFSPLTDPAGWLWNARRRPQKQPVRAAAPADRRSAEKLPDSQSCQPRTRFSSDAGMNRLGARIESAQIQKIFLLGGVQ